MSKAAIGLRLILLALAGYLGFLAITAAVSTVMLLVAGVLLVLGMTLRTRAVHAALQDARKALPRNIRFRK